MKLFSEESPERFSAVDHVLFDIDDTITRDGLLEEASFATLWRLRESGIRAIPVTGRPAGWCDCIARQWPVDAVIGENGAFVMYMRDGKLHRVYNPEAPALDSVRDRLVALEEDIRKRFPDVRIAKDQSFRLFDVAFDFAEEAPVLGLDFAERICRACEDRGATAKISSIHVNAWFGKYTKRSMAAFVLQELFGVQPEDFGKRVVFFGDSPNDEPMFRFFPLSCGVANLMNFKDYIEFFPPYITRQASGKGFAEACQYLIAARKK